MKKPFSNLTYPGHSTVLALALISLIGSVTGIVIDRAYIFAFAVSPILMLKFGFYDAGLRFTKDPLGYIIFNIGCIALLVAVFLIQYKIRTG